MNCCRETTRMGGPARHREPARSGEAGGPPGNRPAVPRDWFRGVPERYVAGGACPEPVEGTPEDARLPARRAYSSERRTFILFALAPLRSVPQAGSQFHNRSSRFMNNPG